MAGYPGRYPGRYPGTPPFLHAPPMYPVQALPVVCRVPFWAPARSMTRFLRRNNIPEPRVTREAREMSQRRIPLLLGYPGASLGFLLSGIDPQVYSPLQDMREFCSAVQTGI